MKRFVSVGMLVVALFAFGRTIMPGPENCRPALIESLDNTPRWGPGQNPYLRALRDPTENGCQEDARRKVYSSGVVIALAVVGGFGSIRLLAPKEAARVQ